MTNKLVVIIFLTTLLINFTSCSFNQYILPQPASLQAEKHTYIHALQNTYPKEFTAIQRIVLQIRNKQYDFLGYLAMSRNNAFRATVFSDMGGKFIDLYYNGEKLELIHKPTGIPDKPISNGVTYDIKHLFEFIAGNNTYLVRNEKKEISVVIIISDNKFEEYIFQDNKKEMASSRSVHNGRIIREAWYQNYANFEGFDYPVPQKIFIKNYQWHYELEIELLKIVPEVKTHNAFPTE